MTVKGGTTPACAVCKYQRRKCSPNCPLAPYFPANQPKMFQNVHRLFGVSNITKILESLSTDDQKEDAMKSIIYEAEMRHRFPVHGCWVILCQLRLQLNRALDELRCVYAQIAACKEQMNRTGSSFRIQPIENEAFLNENAGPFCDEMVMMNHDINHMAAIQAHMNAFGIQQEEEEISTDNYFRDLKGVHQEEEISDNYFQDFKRVHDRKTRWSPSELSLKETTTAHISESELKSAAAGFSLIANTNRLF